MSKIAILNEFSIEAVKDALQKLESFPNLKVNGLNAYQLTELSAIDPELFAKISNMIKADRWFPYLKRMDKHRRAVGNCACQELSLFRKIFPR